MLNELGRLRDIGAVEGFACVAGDDFHATSLFVAAKSIDALNAVATQIGATVSIEPARLMLECYRDLDQLLADRRTDYVPSGFGAKQLDTSTLQYQSVDVKYANWPPGCFQQRSNGRLKYIFVDDDDSRYVCDRWVATHAEIRRRRRRGEYVPEVLRWDDDRERMIVRSSAQMPLPWARAAAFCSGLSPRRQRGEIWWDVFEGIPLHMYLHFKNALEIPASREDLSAFDKGVE